MRTDALTFRSAWRYGEIVLSGRKNVQRGFGVYTDACRTRPEAHDQRIGIIGLVRHDSDRGEPQTLVTGTTTKH